MVSTLERRSAGRKNRTQVAIIALMFSVAAVSGCGDDDESGVGPSDSVPPAGVTDLSASASPLRASSVTLSWTAPGDDGAEGTASEYDVRYSAATITEDNFDAATSVPTPFGPGAAGIAESVKVNGLGNAAQFFFALRTADDAENWSTLSNVTSATTVAALLPITTDAASDAEPHWSPIGDRIAFQSNRSGNGDIWIIPAVGGTATQLTTDPGEDEFPAWSPDGTMIAWAFAGDIWVMPAAGGTATQVTTDPGLDFDPCWSPDGSMIAYVSLSTGGDVYVIPAAGGVAVQLTTDASFDDDPAWSPDGSTIAFSTFRSGGGDIWMIPAAGGTATQVTTDPGFDSDASWSPDGTQIAFSASRSGGGIWVIPATGGMAAPVTDGLSDVDSPSWSPDGGRLAFRNGANIWSVAVD